MFAHFLLLVVLSAVSASPVFPGEQAIGGRIVGGEDGTIEDFPYMVSVMLHEKHICGGAVVTDSWIISAAHCFERPADQYAIRAGSSRSDTGGSVHPVETYVIHPSFEFPAPLSNDIALVKLLEPLQFSAQVKPVTLPPYRVTPLDGTPGIISGFGSSDWSNTTPRPNLIIGEVPIISQFLCRLALLFHGRVTDDMLCAGYTNSDVDFCQGDDGGPLVVRGILHGIASWGAGCRTKGIPSVYARVSAFTNWIEDTICA